MADQTSYTFHEAEEAPLLYEMESLQPVSSSVANLSASLSAQQDQASLLHQNSLEIPRFGNLKHLSVWIPELDPDRSQGHTFRTWWSKRTTVLGMQQVIAAIVFGVNLGWTIWAKEHYRTLDGIGTIYLGNCISVKRINLWLYLLINSLSTLLLGSSNYCMQLLVAPTHSEVQKAHKKSVWLDIGAPSVRNLRWISKGSVFVCWNSAILASIPAYKYTAAFTTQDYSQHNESWGGVDLDRIRSSTIGFERLDNTRCIERYINSLNYGKDVVVVTNKTSSANDGNAFLGSYDLDSWPYEGLWVCASPEIGSRLGDRGCTSDFIKPFMNNWTVVYKHEPYYNSSDIRESVPVLYCLSAGVHSKDEGCGVHFSVPIMIFVCILNLIKCFCITSLTTVGSLLGEAIAERKRDSTPTNLIALWKEGLGAVSDHELIGRGFNGSVTQTFLETVLLANAPQLLFSFLYYLYNGLLTCMSVAEEQSQHGVARKSLRVSAPVSNQRSTWFLSLPYRYGVPLIICSGLLHWLVSQAMFFVRVLMYNDDGSVEFASSASRVGFSPIGIILAFTFASILVDALAAVGFINRFPRGERAMPLISTCSAAITAAGHPPEDDRDAYLLPRSQEGGPGARHWFASANETGEPLCVRQVLQNIIEAKEILKLYNVATLSCDFSSIVYHIVVLISRSLAGSNEYALKMFKFYDDIEHRAALIDEEKDLVSVDLLSAHMDPFFNQCRAYGQLVESEPKLPFNATKTMPKDLKTMHARAGCPSDGCASARLRGWTLVDMSSAMTTPHFLFNIRPRRQVFVSRLEDLRMFDQMMDDEEAITWVGVLPNKAFCAKLRSRSKRDQVLKKRVARL
ncbi:MAG: hypothetical protein ASARMPRED_002513 [Alectoria sarmentosa]|nr:MAG: hypothetical protein ASARMPRED_002513 [Alectoria sarmentosa]